MDETKRAKARAVVDELQIWIGGLRFLDAVSKRWVQRKLDDLRELL